MSSESPEIPFSEERSSTVCHLCRQRKTKCDRRLPNCSFCAKAKVRCQYVTKTKKRGLRAGYVSQLENRLETLEQEVEKFKHERTTSSTATPNPILSPPLAATSSPHQPIDISPPQHSISNTPSVSHVELPKSNATQAESDAAVADLTTLSHAYLHTLADSWFKETQPWYPILSRQHIQDALDALPLPLTHIDDVVLKAVIALQIAYSSQAICLGYNGRYRLSQYLRSQVVNEAFSKASLKSLQALLIIAILDYGSDNIPSTFSILAVCRRMCENIGLFRKLLNQMQLQSPAQVGPPAIGSNTGDELAIPLTWSSLAMDAVSTLGISWRDVSAAVMDHLSSVAYVSTPDLRDSFRSHTHLAAIGLQPLHNFLYDHEQGRYDQAKGQAFATCDEIYHNLMNYVRAQPATSYTLLADGLIDFDPNLVLTSILSHASVIILYARLIEADETSCNEIPLQRCLQACEDIVLALRSISDADAELSTPVLGTMLFVAARFKLVIYRKMNQQRREPIFDTLMHGISMCGRRWSVARRQDLVLRAAIVEVDTGNDALLPASFWNVKKSHLDISEELKEWVADHQQSLYIGSLNGPYV
ncbi:Fungal Zn2-Cys6 binuclear cluster domain-containing protein [Cladophialophora immunda]|nr:Fungal Zn2-Cys6 binuclear cluster domain-containing protein [Cladophialophora immunda]